MAIVLTDDGTLDTVLRCTECGEEFRFNYANSDGEESRDTWIECLIDETADEHACIENDLALGEEE